MMRKSKLSFLALFLGLLTSLSACGVSKRDNAKLTKIDTVKDAQQPPPQGFQIAVDAESQEKLDALLTSYRDAEAFSSFDLAFIRGEVLEIEQNGEKAGETTYATREVVSAEKDKAVLLESTHVNLDGMNATSDGEVTVSAEDYPSLAEKALFDPAQLVLRFESQGYVSGEAKLSDLSVESTSFNGFSSDVVKYRLNGKLVKADGSSTQLDETVTQVTSRHFPAWVNPLHVSRETGDGEKSVRAVKSFSGYSFEEELPEVR